MTDDTWDRIESLQERLETSDVGQKRYLMYRIFDQVLEKVYELRDETVDETEKVLNLKDGEGYLYKLSQDFLVSSSTGEKHRKLDKIITYVRNRTD